MTDRGSPSVPSEFVSEATQAVSVRQIAHELVEYREVVWAFTSRSFRLRYKQTLLGVAWVVLQPLLFLFVFVLVFGRAVNISGGGAPYAAFAISALVPWSFVSSSVSYGGNALVTDSTLLRKVYFPREAPVLGSIVSYLPDLLIGTLLILLAVSLTGASIGWSLVTLPLLVIALVVPVTGVSLPLAALSVYYRDFRYVVPFAIQVWLFASPVAYPLTVVPDQWRLPYAAVNPIVGPLEGFRRVFALGEAPDWPLLGVSGASGLVLVAIGYLVFKRLERQLADVV